MQTSNIVVYNIIQAGVTLTSFLEFGPEKDDGRLISSRLRVSLLISQVFSMFVRRE
jgi:hypothetical protein